uniref:Calmodulin binding protein-like N-terminal domain-containing protein n=1 Tax=Leersia perrieri TaxID=77586 RepID=A0A0D9XV14_9ORYZ
MERVKSQDAGSDAEVFGEMPHRQFGRDRIETLEEMRRMLQGQNAKIESMHRENQELREKVSFLTADITRLGGYLQQSPVTSNNKYSTHKIEADDGTPLKVAIYDHNSEILACEPFSSMRVHIVAIHGDFDDDHKGQWTEEHFRSKIVTGRPGKEYLLAGSKVVWVISIVPNSKTIPVLFQAKGLSWGSWLLTKESLKEFRKDNKKESQSIPM